MIQEQGTVSCSVQVHELGELLTQAESGEESAGRSEVVEVAPRVRAAPRAAAMRKPVVVDLSSSGEDEEESEAEEDSEFDGDDE